MHKIGETHKFQSIFILVITKLNEEDNTYLKKGAAAYQLGNTSSRTITEVKQH